MNEVVAKTLSEKEEKIDSISILTDFFKLIDRIDQRLKHEDPEYRAKYYPDEYLGKEDV